MQMFIEYYDGGASIILVAVVVVVVIVNANVAVIFSMICSDVHRVL